MLDHQKAMSLWEQIFGDAIRAKDCKGRLMDKGAYGQTTSKYGWNVHHKKPKSQGGTDAFENLEPVHVKTHAELNKK